MSGWCSLMACSSSRAYCSIRSCVISSYPPNILCHQGILATPPYSNPENVRPLSRLGRKILRLSGFLPPRYMVGLEAHHVSAVSAHGAYKLNAAGFVGVKGLPDLPFCAVADQASRLTPALKVLLYKMPPIFEHDV